MVKLALHNDVDNDLNNECLYCQSLFTFTYYTNKCDIEAESKIVAIC